MYHHTESWGPGWHDSKSVQLFNQIGIKRLEEMQNIILQENNRVQAANNMVKKSIEKRFT